MNTLRCLIVDDEAPAREIVKLLLKEHPQIEICGECSDGPAAVELIRQEKPDLVFLDIQMPGMSGFDVLRALDEPSLPYIIFITAYDQYAIEAFEINAIDYLLKPFKDERFHLAIKRAQSAFAGRAAEKWTRQLKELLGQTATTTRSDYVQKLSVKVGSKIRFVPVEDINWISAENQYVRLYTDSGNFLLRQSLGKLEELLSPQDFYRTHRSAIVRIQAIRQIEPYFKGDFFIYLESGTKVKLSRKRVEGLRRIMPW